MDKTDVVVEMEDSAATVEQVVAYERFWKMIAERMLVKGNSNERITELDIAEDMAA